MYLGIDFGLKKIGLAFSESGILATKLGQVQNNDNTIQNIKNRLDSPITKIIIGVSQGQLSSQFKDFKFKLETSFNCEVILVDEFNSTQEAIQNQISSAISKKNRRHDDSSAATIILQRYLDSLPQSI